MNTFLGLTKNIKHKGQPKVRRWLVYFALNFNLLLKKVMKHEKA